MIRGRRRIVWKSWTNKKRNTNLDMRASRSEAGNSPTCQRKNLVKSSANDGTWSHHLGHQGTFSGYLEVQLWVAKGWCGRFWELTLFLRGGGVAMFFVQSLVAKGCSRFWELTLVRNSTTSAWTRRFLYWACTVGGVSVHLCAKALEC